MRVKAEQREPLALVFKGRNFAATFTTSISMVHVTSIYGRKSTQLGAVTTQSLAEALFREILEEADALGTLT